MRRGIYVLPNAVTTASLFCGFLSIVASTNQDYVKAAWFILLALIFDGLDGRVARATHTQSEFGVQYDSLSDLVSFGAAPALLAYRWALVPFESLGWFAAFTFLACGALRLARFNVHTETVPSDKFEGLPIPAAAAFVASFVLLYYHLQSAGSADLLDKPLGKFLRLSAMTNAVDTNNMAVLGLFYGLGFLMISQIPFTSFKKMTLFKRHPYMGIFLVLMALNVLVYHPQATIFGAIALYVLSGPVLGLVGVLRRPRGEKSTDPTTGNGGTAEEADKVRTATRG
jgi:CDP-diacylglycerol--serine O-phosphatidyltransferase